MARHQHQQGRIAAWPGYALADQRAYTDRRTLVTPAGWTRRYTIHTSANFERSKDESWWKVLMICELTIFGLGCIPNREEWPTMITSTARKRNG